MILTYPCSDDAGPTCTDTHSLSIGLNDLMRAEKTFLIAIPFFGTMYPGCTEYVVTPVPVGGKHYVLGLRLYIMYLQVHDWSVCPENAASETACEMCFLRLRRSLGHDESGV